MVVYAFGQGSYHNLSFSCKVDTERCRGLAFSVMKVGLGKDVICSRSNNVAIGANLVYSGVLLPYLCVLSIYFEVSIYLSVCLSIYLSTYLPVYLLYYLYICTYPPIDDVSCASRLRRWCNLFIYLIYLSICCIIYIYMYYPPID